MTSNDDMTGGSAGLGTEAERVAAVARLKLFESDPYQSAFDDAALLASAICDTPIGLITVLDGTYQHFKASAGIQPTVMLQEKSFCVHTIQQRELFVVGDTLLDSRFREMPFVVRGPKVRFYAGMPLATKEGFAVGTLCVLDTKPRILTENQAKALSVLSRRVSAYFEARERLIQLTETIAEKERIESELRNRNLIFDALMDNSPLACYMKQESGQIFYYNRRFAEEMGISRSEGLGKDEFQVFPREVAAQLRQLDEEVMQSDALHVIETEIPLHEGRQRHSRIYKFSFVNAYADRFLVAISHEMTEERKAKEALNKAHAKLLKVNKRLRGLSITDPLTGCKNRRFFDKRLRYEVALAKRHNLNLAVMLIDVDNLRSVNDGYGYEAGDRVLKHIAHLLTKGARRTDIVCRYGGEEFAVLLPHTSEKKALPLADRMRASIEREWDGCPVTISIGIGRYSAEIAEAAELVRGADEALSRAKISGKNRVVLAA